MAAADLQDLLRFLSHDAKVPLAAAMGKVKALQQASLTTPERISNTSLKEIQTLFGDEKLARQVHNAAKKANKKRSSSGGADAAVSKRSKQKIEASSNDLSTAEFEASLALPSSDADEEELKQMVFFTNRAPLLLAFVVTLLSHTMPEQPISSRLSLAYAYISVSSRSRAVDLGIERGTSAEEDGWGQGQPFVTIMGRKIRVMRRSGYDVTNVKQEDIQGTQTVNGDQQEEVALWGLDLEALKSSNMSIVTLSRRGQTMPIYTAQSARAYLLKAAQPIPYDGQSSTKTRTTTATERKAAAERNLGMLLKTIDLVFRSWKHVTSTTALDNRTWAWYAQVRPDVAYGKDGWGKKNEVKLSKILDLRKKGEAIKSEVSEQ